MRPAVCQKTSLWETDSPDTGEVALAPEGERWPEGPEGESLAFARNLRACVKLSPPPPAGGAPSQRGPRSFSTIWGPHICGPPTCRRIPSRNPLLFLRILYKFYISHTKRCAPLQNLYRDCTVPWSIPAKKGGTIGSFR